MNSCPKSMIFGPCGGVTPVGGCEVDDRPCPFVTESSVPWQHPPREVRPARLPEIIVDVRPDPSDPDFDESIDTLVAAGVAGLIGDHVDDPPGTSTVDSTRRLVGREMTVVATVACRDRSAGECRHDVRALVDAGATAVLCVTGDHPAVRFGSDATAEFALDSTRLASLARSLDAYVAVAESPMSVPVDRRARRTLQKQNAGADVVILNHAGGVTDLERFADDARELGVSMPMAAPVPVISDAESLSALTAFPGVHLPPEVVDEFERSIDPSRAGIEAAIAMGRRLRATGRFAHLNLSGRATNGGQLERCRTMAHVADQIRRP